MKRVGLLVVAVALLASSWWDVSAQGNNAVMVTVIRSADSGQEGECSLDPNGDYAPWPQLIVTDAAGVIAGYLDLVDAEYITFEDGVTGCTVYDTLLLSPSPFYTFTVGGEYQRTVSDDVIGEVEDYLLIQLP